jgi:hypothetical protein
LVLSDIVAEKVPGPTVIEISETDVANNSNCD